MTGLVHILLAAGTGSRHGGTLPKQFCPMWGRPVVMEAIDRLRLYGCGGEILLVLSPAMEGLWKELCREHGLRSPRVVHGGAERYDSVRCGLAALPAGTEIVSVHDAARPLLPEGLIARLIAGMKDGAVPVTPVVDTIRRIDQAGGSEVIPRRSLVAVQTPQVFPAAKLIEAYSRPLPQNVTDDASVMEAAGFRDIVLVDGTPQLRKITTQGDIAALESIARPADERIS